MIRLAKSTDFPELKRIAEGTNMFLDGELESFLSELQQYFQSVEGGADPLTTLTVAVEGNDETGPLTGAAYFTPEVMAQGVMNLLFIGVAPEARNRGVGQSLLQQFEDTAQSNSARLAIIETASDQMFAPAWALYRKMGYGEEARIRDFFDDGLDKLIFLKRL